MRRLIAISVLLVAISGCPKAPSAAPAAAGGGVAAAEPAGDEPAGGSAGAVTSQPEGVAGIGPDQPAPSAGSTATSTEVAGSDAAGAGGNSATAGTSSEAPDTRVTDSEGCPLSLIGFATLEGGTSGGGNADPTRVTSQAELRACATAAEPRVCVVQGTLQFSPFEEINVKSDKTILGAGTTAEIVMGGFRLNAGVHNVIIRNLTIRDSFVEGQYEEGGDEGGDRDGVQMDTAHHVWIDHVHFKHLGDGLIDSRKDTTFLTVSWNVLEQHNKAFGIGWTENVTAQLTIHHNWIHDTVQRNPSTDNVLRAHLFNNLLENVESYGNYSRGMTNMVLQNSVFVRVKDPHYHDSGTLVATGNIYRNTTGRKVATGDTFSSFDPSMFYPYTLDSAEDAEAIVKRCAGPRAELKN